VLCETRKLILSAKYWIKTIKPGLDAFDELFIYLEGLNSGNRTIPTKSRVTAAGRELWLDSRPAVRLAA
jgi:hypothetical protein